MEGGRSLLALGAFLDDGHVRHRFADVGRLADGHDGVAALKAEGPVLLRAHVLAVQPDAEIIFSAVGGAQLQLVSVEFDDGIDAAPVEGYVAVADLGAADPGDPGVGGGEFIRPGVPGGRNEAVLFRHGEVIRKIKGDIAAQLIEEIEKL